MPDFVGFNMMDRDFNLAASLWGYVRHLFGSVGRICALRFNVKVNTGMGAVIRVFGHQVYLEGHRNPTGAGTSFRAIGDGKLISVLVQISFHLCLGQRQTYCPKQFLPFS
ncbi:hypothetical protein ACQKRQ_34390 [Paraburkholderia sp. NPDC080076]|uniref:hypothetical protein n=1 Tax=Paraburkholderia sp. NPDC080076 TaxID=3390605 RepID=UPI003D074667